MLDNVLRVIEGIVRYFLGWLLIVVLIFSGAVLASEDSTPQEQSSPEGIATEYLISDEELTSRVDSQSRLELLQNILSEPTEASVTGVLESLLMLHSFAVGLLLWRLAILSLSRRNIL